MAGLYNIIRVLLFPIAETFNKFGLQIYLAIICSSYEIGKSVKIKKVGVGCSDQWFLIMEKD
jgi:hypothetical protein